MNNTISTENLNNIGLKSNKELVNAQAASKGKLGQEQFLKLMVTQIQNQDPFKPMENGDFLSQIAQFGTVSGIEDLQKSFSGLSTALISNQATQASSLIGRSIVVETENFNLLSGKNLKGLVDMSSASTSVAVDILDASNQVIKTIQLGPQSKGLVNFTWDGTNSQNQAVPAGNYKMVARANIGGKDVAMQTLIQEKVESVSIGNTQQGLLLNTASKSTYGFNQVKQVQ